MRIEEMTEDEQQALRKGLRILARMIARHHFKVRAAEAANRGESSEGKPPGSKDSDDKGSDCD